MSTPTPVPQSTSAWSAFWSALWSTVSSDTIVTVGPVMITFLQAVQSAQGDPAKLALALGQLDANLLVSAPSLVAQIEGQIAAALIEKIQEAMASAQPAPTPAPAKPVVTTPVARPEVITTVPKPFADNRQQPRRPLIAQVPPVPAHARISFGGGAR